MHSVVWYTYAEVLQSIKIPRMRCDDYRGIVLRDVLVHVRSPFGIRLRDRATVPIIDGRGSRRWECLSKRGSDFGRRRVVSKDCNLFIAQGTSSRAAASSGRVGVLHFVGATANRGPAVGVGVVVHHLVPFVTGIFLDLFEIVRGQNEMSRWRWHQRQNLAAWRKFQLITSRSNQ